MTSPSKLISCLLTTFALGADAQADLMFNIIESPSGVTFDVDGAVSTTAISNPVLWNSAIVNSRPAWASSSPSGQNDLFQSGANQDIRSHSVQNATDTGNMSVSVFYEEPAVVTGTPFSVGGRFEVGNILLDANYVGQALDFTVFWSGADLTDFGLLAGQSRVIEYDNGVGGREAIRWSVTSVPEPSAFIYGGLIAVLAGVVVHIKRRQSKVAVM